MYKMLLQELFLKIIENSNGMLEYPNEMVSNLHGKESRSNLLQIS